MVFQERLYTNKEFWEISQLPENQNKRLELIDGVIHDMASSSKKNTITAVRISARLLLHADANDLGYVAGADSGFDLGPGNVRQPDAAFISKDRVVNLEGTTFSGAPDLAVDVITPGESPRGVTDKARLYLQTGAKLVWAVYPDNKVVDVYRLADNEGGLHIQTIDINGTLNGEDVLPGFTLPLNAIFPE
jgi:Uma2 family endonuclease